MGEAQFFSWCPFLHWGEGKVHQRADLVPISVLEYGKGNQKGYLMPVPTLEPRKRSPEQALGAHMHTGAKEKVIRKGI